MAQKPSIPKGTRDFPPLEMARRDYIFETIRTVFKKYGYSPIETPAMENLSTLLGKYGEEGDKLLFKVLNSGDAFSGVTADMLGNSNSLSVKVCEKGLRYDLTVPFARFVVQHQNELTFPFKRYQIQPVWRADRPQKGRYREFYQCDVDVVGSRSLLNELELVQIVDEIFGLFGIKVLVKINNRKILTGIAEVIGKPEKLTDITVAIDKIDKIGLDAVKQELYDKGLTLADVSVIEPVLTLSGTTSQKVEVMKGVLAASEAGLTGLDEITELFGLIESVAVNCSVELDLSLARGLNYYTGAIFEVKALETEMGSICGGGRYDDLTGIFGLPDVPGVGISFGADRIYDVLLTLYKFPGSAGSSAKVLFSNLGADEVKYSLPIIKAVREAGVSAELYPDNSKMKKQFDYADKKGIPFFAIVGADEVSAGKVSLKNLKSGEQKSLDASELIALMNKID
jgi:histidyl-tRNA synthetase